MTGITLTRGELERNLSQSIQAFYHSKLGCRTKKVSCHLINEQVAIAIKNPITPVETLLSGAADHQFARDLRARIDTIIKQDLIATIESNLGVGVIAMTIDTTVDSNLTGIVALLSQKPETRDSKRTRDKLKPNKDI